jgi:hypothetical protein
MIPGSKQRGGLFGTPIAPASEQEIVLGGLMKQGQRCRARHNINGHQGLIRARTDGTIQFETNNLGRRLIGVQWDGSFQMYVFPDEIELIQSHIERDSGSMTQADCIS